MPEPEKTGYEHLSDEDLIKHYHVNKHDYLDGCDLVNRHHNDSHKYVAEDFYQPQNYSSSTGGNVLSGLTLYLPHFSTNNALIGLLHGTTEAKNKSQESKALKSIHKELQKRKEIIDSNREMITNQQLRWLINPINLIKSFACIAGVAAGSLIKLAHTKSGKQLQKMSEGLVKDAPALKLDAIDQKAAKIGNILSESSEIVKHINNATNTTGSKEDNLGVTQHVLALARLKEFACQISDDKQKTTFKKEFLETREYNKKTIEEMRKDITPANSPPQ